jgi:hypothetical protein
VLEGSTCCDGSCMAVRKALNSGQKTCEILELQRERQNGETSRRRNYRALGRSHKGDLLAAELLDITIRREM